MLMVHKRKGENYEITTIRIISESHLHWKSHFHKNPIIFRIYADFAADNEFYKLSVGKKTTKTFKQNPILNGYNIESELEDVSKSGYFESPLGYNNVDWFVDEVIKLEKRLSILKTLRNITLTEEDEERYRKNIVCRFCEKNIKSDKIRDQCHLTGKYRSPAHNQCNTHVTQDQNNFQPFVFHNFSNYDCHLFFKKLFAEKNDKVKFKIILQPN